MCSARYAYFVPYAYGTSHMRILMPIVPRKFIFIDFNAKVYAPFLWLYNADGPALMDSG